MQLMTRRTLTCLMLLVAMCGATGCGKPKLTPTPVPTPFIPFPDVDTPFTTSSGAQQEIWAAYQVQTIPGKGALGDYPTPPPVVNSTHGVVSDATAKEWAIAYFRDEAWQRWAMNKAQGDFLGHIDEDARASSDLRQGSLWQVPDCYLFPTSMVLQSIHPDTIGTSVGRNNQYQFQMNFTAPPAAKCEITVVAPDGRSTKRDGFSGVKLVTRRGYLRHDYLLGELWISGAPQGCVYRCVIGTASAPANPPPFPETDSPIATVTPEQRYAWEPYAVAIVPRAGVIKGLPKAPAVINATDGVVDEATAQEWAQALYQQAAWAEWELEQRQQSFQSHIGNPQTFNQGISSLTRRGGTPAMPDCAVFPETMTLSIINKDQAKNQATIVKIDEFVWTLTYKQPCTVTVSFLNGTSTTVDTPGTVLNFGSIHVDPYLGEFWYPDAIEVVTKKGL